MKRIKASPIGVLGLLLAISACTNETLEPGRNELSRITMTAEDFEADGESRTNFQITSAGAEFSWAANDTVGIFPSEGAQAYFPMTAGAGTKNASFTGGGWALKDASVYAAYYPFIGNFYLNRNAAPVNYGGQVQKGDASTAHLGAYDYMAAAPSSPSGGSVNFAFKHLGVLVQLKLRMPSAADLESVALTSAERVFAVKGEVDLMSSVPAISAIELADEIKLETEGLSASVEGQMVTLYMMLPPCDLSGKTLVVNINDKNGSVYTSALAGKNMIAGKAYAYEAEAIVGEAVTNVALSSAGTLLAAIGGYEKLHEVEKLKVTGDINGDDVYEIRRMANLKYLNLKDAHIVEGGESYYRSYKTKPGVIGESMFAWLPSLEEVILPTDIETIDSDAFYSSGVKNIVIHEGVKRIGNQAFVDNKFTSIKLPQSLEIVEYCAFLSSKLEEITIPENVREIGRSAFLCHELKIVRIKAHPETLTSVGDDAFQDVYRTATLYIPKGTKEAYVKTELGRFANIVEE